MSERKTKRESGAFYRKRKAEKDKQEEKLRNSMLKFVKLDEDNNPVSTSARNFSIDEATSDNISNITIPTDDVTSITTSPASSAYEKKKY